MKGYVAIGLTVLAGAALVEVALVPAVVAGGAAVLAPRYVRKLRRRLQPTFDAMTDAITRRAAPAPRAAQDAKGPAASVAGPGIKQAIAKTITFRIIVTTLDFSTNYLVIGELSTAAGLSTFNLIAGPLFYLAHETAWNYLGPGEDVAVNLPASLTLRPDAKTGAGGLTMSRALAKTITFRTIASVVDFVANYVVVRDVATAAGLSAFGFVAGPFVYLAHEKAWDYFSAPKDRSIDLLSQTKLLPAPR